MESPFLKAGVAAAQAALCVKPEVGVKKEEPDPSTPGAKPLVKAEAF